MSENKMTQTSAEEKLKLIEKYCIEISEDEKAMCGEQLTADEILEIIHKKIER